MAEDKIVVGIADMKLAQGDGMLITYALGSCIGVCFYESTLKIAALLHIMLPQNLEQVAKNVLKYADTGIRETLRQMEARGARKQRITAKLAGGAKMFEVAGGVNLGNIGDRNIEQVHICLRETGIRILAEDVGGSIARTMLFDAASGQACVRSYGRAEIIF